MSRGLISALLLLGWGCDVYHPESLRGVDAGMDAQIVPGGDAGPRDAGPPDTGIGDAGPSDGGRPDAGPPDGGGDAGPACPLRHPPARPGGADGSGPTRVFGLRDVVVDQRGDRWQDVALDLDDVCTEDNASASCLPRTGGGARGDGVEGVDNAGGQEVLRLLIEADPDAETRARESQERGDGVVVLTVEGWSGEPDDPSVVAWVGQGLYGVPAGGALGDPLRWDGTDALFLSEDDFVDADPSMPLIIDDAAYVSGGRLVMAVPDGRPILFPWSGNRLELRLTDAFLTGALDTSSLSDVRLAGRWALIDMRSALTAMGVCPGTTERFAVDRLIEMVADVRSDDSTDGIGADCDAVSLGVGFTGYPATVGGAAPVEPRPPACP